MRAAIVSAAEGTVVVIVVVPVVPVVRHRWVVRLTAEEVIESSSVERSVDRVSVNDLDRRTTCEHEYQMSSDQIGEHHPGRSEVRRTGEDSWVVKEEAFSS